MSDDQLLPCIAISQPIGTFYITKIAAKTALAKLDILRRGMSDDERRNVQRRLSGERQSEIANYVIDPEATFPTSIIVATYPDNIEVISAGNVLKFNTTGKFGEVLNGQHRLEGLRLAIDLAVGRVKEDLEQFELPIVFMIDLSPEDRAYVFSVINSKQRSVSSSLIVDLFGLAQTRSPTKSCHEIAQTLNSNEGGPFFRGLKMLGTRYYSSEYLTQGAFVKYLLTLVAKDAAHTFDPNSVGPISATEFPLWQFFQAGEDGQLAKIIDNYFGAVADAFPEEWWGSPKDYLIRKTAGYAALIRVFRVIWAQDIVKTKRATKAAFMYYALRMKIRMKLPITSDYFASSEQGAKLLANQMIEAVYGRIFARDISVSANGQAYVIKLQSHLIGYNATVVTSGLAKDVPVIFYRATSTQIHPSSFYDDRLLCRKQLLTIITEDLEARRFRKADLNEEIVPSYIEPYRSGPTEYDEVEDDLNDLA